MPIKRHFLGWDGPIVEKVSAWLLADRAEAGPVDLRDTLIVVPTLQAGRRLREVLAQHCHKRKSVLLSAAIVTPRHFFARVQADSKPANAALTMAVWSHLLATVDLAEFSVFFPNPQKPQSADRFQWALSTGAIIERLRQELAEGGYGIPDVISRHAADLAELERWKDLAALEQRYLKALAELGYADSCRLKVDMADKPEVDPDVRRVVLACVPDPVLLAVRALENLSRHYSIEILVHAPEAMSAKFDEFGRPIPGIWAKETVNIPEWDRNVFLEASPEMQAKKAVEVISGLPAEYGPADIGIGVPDPAVIPFIEQELQAVKLPAFDPADVPFSEHSIGRMVDSMSSLARTRAYVHVADLIRHPDFLRYLEEAHKIQSLDVLTQLDEFQNYYLPAGLDSMLAPFQAPAAGRSGGHADYAALGKALKIIAGHVDEFGNRPLEDAWRNFLRAVYASRVIKQDIAGDREFQQAADMVEQVFREIRDVPAGKLGLDKRLASVFARRLRAQAYSRERNDEIIDLQGWLELPWTDTPVLVVTGLNEEFVPGGSLSGVFLPDSLRKILRLRDDLSRFGRDVYLLKTLVESRRQHGRLSVVVGKYTLAGDPLRPSRLLFQCRDAELPARARRLFQPIEQAERAEAAAVIFQLKPAAAEADTKITGARKISATAFRDYLACPFRFYLRHVLRMEPLSDAKNEPDALDFGVLVHEVLQVMGANRELWACRDAGVLGKKLADLAEESAARRYGKIIPPAALVALSSARARLEALAREQVDIAGAGWEIIAAEQTKSIVRQGFTITGKIDRIDRHKQSGLLRIIDYKTSDRAKSPQSEHLAPRRTGPAADYNRYIAAGRPGARGNARATEKKWVDLQLPLYRLMCGQNGDVELAYFILTRALSEIGLSPWSEFNQDMLASAGECIDGVLADIAARKFWPPAERVDYGDDFAMLFPDAPEKVFDLTGFPA